MTKTVERAFNLLDEPWIPVLVKGVRKEIALRDCLLSSTSIDGIAEASPPNFVALHRLLLATLHRSLTLNYGPWRTKDLARWVARGLPARPIRKYLHDWRDRFWLFHPHWPFMQVADLAISPETKNKEKPWTQICLDRASGNNPVLFDHSRDEDPQPVPYAEAARHLLGYLQFVPGGLVKVLRTSDLGGPLTDAAAVLVTGRNLAETLLLNLHPWRGDARNDLPAWEKDPPTVEDLRTKPMPAKGPNDRYTRLSRAVLLLLDAENPGFVRHILFAAGLPLGANQPDLEPMVSLNQRGDPIGFEEGRAFWRDLPSLVPDPAGGDSQPAPVLSYASNLLRQRRRDLSGWLTVVAAGVASRQAKVERWRIEQVRLPEVLLAEPAVARELRCNVELAEKVHSELEDILVDLAREGLSLRAGREASRLAREYVRRSPLSRVYFAYAEQALPSLCQGLAHGQALAATAEWRRALRQAAQTAWQVCLASLGSSASLIRAEAKFQPRFIYLLKKHRLLEECNP